MAPILDRLRRSVGRFELWAPGARIAAGVSGGSDSVALLFLLHELARSGEIVLAGLVHLDHAVRRGSADDAAFCKVLATRLDIPSVIERVDVPALARDTRQSLEAAGRAAREALFDRAAVRLDADAVAVAHTRDDQAETVLLRLLRGSGTTGLRGILPRRGRIVRPLLDCTRAELVEWLTARGEAWREDPTNADPATPRNRVRLELLPYLGAHFGTGIDAVLARTAEVARADEDLLHGLTSEAFAGVARVEVGRVLLDREALRALPEALQRRVARQALETAAGRRSYGLEETQALVDACGPAGVAAIDLPGVRMERSGETVVLQSGGHEAPEPGPTEGVPLDVPGEAWLSEAGPGVATEHAADGTVVDAPHPGVALVSASQLILPLTVRTRQPGDALRPAGLGGRKKVQDLFVDRKVPRRERDRVPIVVDGRGRIVWVAGHAIDEAFRVTDRSGPVVVLRLVPSRR
jgi:tRNA(Ile)-lysidine synthase